MNLEYCDLLKQVYMTMEFKIEVIEILKKILVENDVVKRELIKAYQNKIWFDETGESDIINELLTTLAYDLDFYEPNVLWRKEDISYYGTERLNEIINDVIVKINNHII